MIDNQVPFQKYKRCWLVVSKTSVLKINSTYEKPTPEYDYFVLKTSSGKIKKFNIVKHRTLEYCFSDLKNRADFQKKQTIFYQLTMKNQ